MAEYRDSIVIKAGPDAVWAVLYDVERWPEWTPSMKRVRTVAPEPVRVGSRVRVRQPRLPPLVWTVTAVEPGRSFSWTSSSAGIRSVADHHIRDAAGGCEVELVLGQTGPLARLSALVYGRLTRRYLRAEAEGLRRRVERPSVLAGE